MKILAGKWLYSLTVLLLWYPVIGKSSNLPVNTWIDQLSVRKDARFEQFQSVGRAIGALDSLGRCEAVARLEEKGPDKKVFRIRLNLLKSMLITQHLFCAGWNSKDALVKEALRMSYEIDDTILIAEGHRHLVNFYQEKGDYGTAGMYGLIARAMQDKAGPEHFLYLAYSHYDLGYVLYHSREYASCIQVTRDALFWKNRPGAAPGDSMSLNYQMIAWNTIGLCYEKLEKYDSAFYAFDQAKRLSIANNNDFWTALIRGNEGSVWFRMGQYDSAEALLRTDYLKSIETGDVANAGNSLLLIAQIHAAEGQGDLALREVREADRYLVNDPGRERHANLLYTYTRVFKALRNADSLDHYMQKYLELHTALEKDAEHTRFDIVKLRIANQEAIHRIILLNAQRERITLIRNFSIILIVIVTVLGFLYFNRQKLKMRLKQQEILEAKAKAKSALDQLNIFTSKMMEKTNLIETLQDQLAKKALNEEQLQHISALSTHSILTDEDWEQFKLLFEKVYPGFFIKLRAQVPDITVAEQRMAALSKLRIPAKEAATLLGISPNSVVKAKSRLRQRLSLDPDADLEKYFSESEG